MAELRRDPITGRWVIIAQNRAQRPREFQVERHVRDRVHCPFCVGHESETPNEVFATRSPESGPNRPGWSVRVVPNKYPALLQSTQLPRTEEFANGYGDAAELFENRAACGVHEVIVEAPSHAIRTTDLNDDQLAEVCRVYRNRLSSLRTDKAIRFGIAFKNVGPEAGATIEHTHSQLVGLPVVPAVAADELGAMATYHKRRDRCLLCDMIQAELAVDRRIVTATSNFVALCPYAARLPFETWILPRDHAADFDAIDDRRCAEVAEILRYICCGIDEALDSPAYNYTILTAPFDSESSPHYHWRIVIIPRLTVIAGFEWGTGCYINPVAPEKAAQQLQITKNVAN